MKKSNSRRSEASSHYSFHKIKYVSEFCIYNILLIQPANEIFKANTHLLLMLILKEHIFGLFMKLIKDSQQNNNGILSHININIMLTCNNNISSVSEIPHFKISAHLIESTILHSNDIILENPVEFVQLRNCVYLLMVILGCRTNFYFFLFLSVSEGRSLSGCAILKPMYYMIEMQMGQKTIDRGVLNARC